MIPPTPAIPRFENNSLLLDTTPDFGDDVSLGELLDPPTPQLVRSAVAAPVASGSRSGRSEPPSSRDETSLDTFGSSIPKPKDGRTLCLDDYLPIEEEDEDVLAETTFTGRGEKAVKAQTHHLARIETRSVSPAISISQPKTDDFYVRRLSTSRPASPHLAASLVLSPVLPPPPPIAKSAAGRSRFARPSVASAAASPPGLSDDEPSRVQLAWRARPPNASRAADSSSVRSNIAKDGSIQKPSSTLPATKARSSALGRYLAKAAVLRPITGSDSAPAASVQAFPTRQQLPSTQPTETIRGKSTETAPRSGDEEATSQELMMMDDRPPSSLPSSDNAKQDQMCGAKLASSPVVRSTAAVATVDLVSTTPPRSSSTAKPSMPLDGRLTPPSLPISATMGTATTPFGIPIPTLVDFSGSDIGTPAQAKFLSDGIDQCAERKPTGGDGRRDDLGASLRSESRSGLVDFFTGFLRGSTSSHPMRETSEAVAKETRQMLPNTASRDEDQGREVIGRRSVGWDEEEKASEEKVGWTESVKTADTTGKRQAGPAVVKPRKPPIPGYIPLTRPARLPPASTEASAARATLPARTNLSKPVSSARPPLASVSVSQRTSATDRPARKAPLPSSFARPTASSEFAKAALAKLPAPGKGHSAAAKPVRVKTPERAHNLASRRKVFEAGSTTSGVFAQPKTSRPLLALSSTGAVARMPAAGRPRPLVKTIPMAGKTPGKASRLRAAERERFDEAVRERMAEKERERMEREKEREREEEDEYLRRRKETVIWAKPVPGIYKRSVAETQGDAGVSG